MSTLYPLPRDTRQRLVTAGAGQTLFGPFDFICFDPADINVYESGIKRAASAYTVSPYGSASFPAFFQVTLDDAPATGNPMSFVSERIHERSLDVTQGGVIRSIELEKELDKQTSVLQEVRRDFGRVLKLPAGETAVELPNAGIRRGKFLGFDATTGDPVLSNVIYAGFGLPLGGATGQQLLKRSSADGDVLWANIDSFDAGEYRLRGVGDVTQGKLARWVGDYQATQSGNLLLAGGWQYQFNTAVAGDFSTVRPVHTYRSNWDKSSINQPTPNPAYRFAQGIPPGDDSEWTYVANTIIFQSDNQFQQNPLATPIMDGSGHVTSIDTTGLDLTGYPPSSNVVVTFFPRDAVGATQQINAHTNGAGTITSYDPMPTTIYTNSPGPIVAFQPKAPAGKGIVTDIGPLLELTRQTFGSYYHAAGSLIGGLMFAGTSGNDTVGPVQTEVFGMIYTGVTNSTPSAARGRMFFDTASDSGGHAPRMIVGEGIYSYELSSNNFLADLGSGWLNFHNIAVRNVGRMSYATGGFNIYTSDGTPLRFGTTNPPSLMVLTNIGVGLNTGSPGTLLDVNGAIRSVGLAGFPTTGTGVSLHFDTVNDYAVLSSLAYATSTRKGYRVNASSLEPFTDGVAALGAAARLWTDVYAQRFNAKGALSSIAWDDRTGGATHAFSWYGSGNVARLFGASPGADLLTLTEAGVLTVAVLAPSNPATSRTNLGVAIGSNVQAWDADLDALAALAGTGIARRTGANAWSVGTTVSVAEGGTGDTGTAWSTYTPTVSAGSGTITTSSSEGRYKQLGKTLFFWVHLTITTNGTGATNLRFTLPPGLNASQTNGLMLGFGTGQGLLYAVVDTAGNNIMSATTAAGAYPATSGSQQWFQGSIELA